MEIQKVKNGENSYDFWLKKDNKELKIMYGGTLDLYLSVSDGDFIPENKITSIDFDITKENYQVFQVFDKLYKNIIAGKPFGPDSDYKYGNYRDRWEYHTLVDKNKNITWISDDGPKELEDKFIFNKVDEDTYRFTFVRNDKPIDYGFKSITSISVRIRNSGSSYSPFNCAFMLMFQELQNLDPKYHQIHFEEIEYEKKLLKKRNSANS